MFGIRRASAKRQHHSAYGVLPPNQTAPSLVFPAGQTADSLVFPPDGHALRTGYGIAGAQPAADANGGRDAHEHDLGLL